MADSAQNTILQNPGMGMGDQLIQQLQDTLEQRRKTGDAAKNPLSLGDATQSMLGMASSMLGFNQPASVAGGPLAKVTGNI